MYFLKKLFIHSPSHYITALLLTVGVGVFRFSTLPEGVGVAFARYEVLSVSGCITFLIGALLMVAYLGAFDLFGYVFSPGRSGEHKRYRDYTHYTEQKVQKREKGPYYFVPYYVVGALTVLLSVVFA